MFGDFYSVPDRIDGLGRSIEKQFDPTIVPRVTGSVSRKFQLSFGRLRNCWNIYTHRNFFFVKNNTGIRFNDLDFLILVLG